MKKLKQNKTEFKGRKSRRDKNGIVKKKYPTERELVNLYAEKICRGHFTEAGFFWVDRDMATARTKSGFDFIFLAGDFSFVAEVKRSIGKPAENPFSLLSKYQALTAEQVDYDQQIYYIFEFVLGTENFCLIHSRMTRNFRKIYLDSL